MDNRSTFTDPLKEPVNLATLTTLGVSSKMLADFVHDCKTIGGNDWHFSIAEPGSLCGRQLLLTHNAIAAGGKILLRWNIASEVLTPERAHEMLAETLIHMAYKHDALLQSVSSSITALYRELNADHRMGEWVARYAGPTGVVVYCEPRWYDLPDKLPTIALSDVQYRVRQFVPLSMYDVFNHYFATFASRWETIYGTKATFRLEHTALRAGNKLNVWLTDGTKQLGWEFAVVAHIDKDTLKPDDWLASFTKDFQ